MEIDNYSAKNIKILSNSEILDVAPWIAAETLAAKYGKDVDFIRRGLEACKLADVEQGYFIRRYLEGDKSVPKNDAVEYHSRVLQGLCH